MATKDSDLPKTTAPTNSEDAGKVEVEPSEGAAPTVDAEPAPAEGTDAQAAEGDGMVVVLSQHYTDESGVNHLPESEIRVSRDKGRSLIESGWASEKSAEGEQAAPEESKPEEGPASE